MSTSELNKSAITLPIIKNLTPDIIARDIVSVQPMTGINLTRSKWERVGMDLSTDRWVYNIRSQAIRSWIEEQPPYMWKFYDIDVYNLDLPASVILGSNYVFTKEMETWFQLRWS